MSQKQEGSSARTSNTYDGLPSYNKNETFPMIYAITQQNGHLSRQIKVIQDQLKKLYKLSEHVLEQNRQLKLHYQARTNDIRNCVSSIQINMNQQMQDIYHQIHLSSEGNYALAKNIQMVLPIIGETIQNLKLLQIQKVSVDEQLMIIQNQKYIVSKVKLQTFLSLGNVQKLKNYQNQLSRAIQNLQDQIGTLSISVGQLKNRNQNQKIKAIRQKNKNQQMRIQIRQLIIHTLNHIKQLKKQLEKIQTQSQIQQNSHQKCLNRHNQLQLKLKEIKRQRAQQRLIWEKQQVQIQLSKQRINKIRKSMNQIQLQKHQKEQQKQQLLNMLKKKKELICIQKENHQNKIQLINHEAKLNLTILKEQFNKKEFQFNDQMLKLRQANMKCQESTNALQKQYQLLNNDVEQYSIFVKSLDNPANQIQKIQMKMRLKQGSRPLATIF